MKSKNTFSLIFFLLFLLLSSFAFADFTEDNQAWVSLQDGNVSSFDLYGGVTGTEGVVNGAFDFDGVDDYVQATGIDLGTGDKTIKFKFKLPVGGISALHQYVDSDNRWNIQFQEDGSNAIYIETLNVNNNPYTFSYDFNPNEWYDVTIKSSTSYNTNEKIHIYINGENLFNISSKVIPELNNNYYFGRHQGSTTIVYDNSYMDEIKMYDSLNEIENNLQFYSSMDSLYDQSNSSNDFSAYNGVTYDATTDSYDFDGTDDYLSDGVIDIQGDLSMSFWYKTPTTFGTEHTFISNYNSAGDRVQYGLRYRSDINSFRYHINGDGSESKVAIPYTLSTDTDYYITAVKDNTNISLYINGTYVGSAINSETVPTTGFGSTSIGRAGDYDGLYLKGQMSGVSIYNRTLSSTEVAQLYAEGRDYSPYDVSANFTISARDSTTLGSINTFNATVNGTFYNTTTGTITLPYLLNNSELLNITVEAEGYFDYFNETYNSSNPLVADLDPELLQDFELLTPNNTKTNASYYNVTWTEAVSPTSKTVTYNISVLYQNGTLKESFITTNLIYELNLTDYNANIYNISVNAEEDSTGVNYTHSSLLYVDKTNYVYFYDGTNSSPLVNSSVTIDRPYGADLSLTTNSEGKVSYQSFDNFTLLNGTHTITYEEYAGYVTPVINIYDATVLPFNITYNITRINLTINIYDEVSGSKITGTNITVDVIDGSAMKYTTTNGTLNFDYFTPGSYEFRYYSTSIDDYKLRSDFITITATSDQDINLYLLNESDTGITTATITFNVFGSDLSSVEDAEVVVGRYYASSNGYVDVWSRKTDSQGKAVGQFETIDAFYQYRVIYDDEVKFISSNSGVQFNTNDDVDIFIDTSTNLVSQYEDLDGIDYTEVNFTQTSNTTGTFQFSFSGDTSATVCLEVTSYNFADNGFNSTCVISTGGTLFLPVEAGNYETTFVAKATIEVSSDLGPQVVDSDTQTLNGLNEPTDSASWKENLAWIAVLVTITSALLFISFSPNAALLFQGIAFLAMTASPIQIVPIPVSVGVVFICIVLLIINVSRGRG